jgi:fucose permease
MFDHLDAAQKRLYAALLANFVALGVSMTIFGATVPQIIDGFGWSYVSTGIVMSAAALGGFLSTLACGVLLKRAMPKILLACGLAAIALGLALFGRSPLAWVNAFVNFMIGAGSGFSEVITNSSVVRMEKPGESRLMNFMHASFCVGAALGPVAVGFLTAARVPFAAVFAGAGAFQALIIGLILLQAFPAMGADGAEKNGSPGKSGIEAPWRRPLFWALVGAMLLYVGVELTYGGWIAEFSARHRFFGSSTAALSVSVFWIGLLAGRLALSFRYRGKRQELMLAALATASVAFFALTVLSPAGGGALSPWTWACAFLTGLSFSGCYPIIMSVLGAEFSGSTVALGICSSAAGAGTFLFPMGTGALASSIGLPRAMLAAAGVDACLAALAFLIVLGRRRAARKA